MIKKTLRFRQLAEVDQPATVRGKAIKAASIDNAVIKNDEPTNNDAQFKGTTKPIDRKANRLGYNPGDTGNYDYGLKTPVVGLPVTKVSEQFSKQSFDQLDESARMDFYRLFQEQAMKYAKIIVDSLNKHQQLINNPNYPSEYPETYSIKDIMNQLSSAALQIATHVENDQRAIERTNKTNILAAQPAAVKESVEPQYRAASSVIKDILKG